MKKFKRLLPGILIPYGIFMFLYLAIAFISIEIDFREWESIARFAYILLSTVFSVFLTAMYYDLNKQNKKSW